MLRDRNDLFFATAVFAVAAIIAAAWLKSGAPPVGAETAPVFQAAASPAISAPADYSAGPLQGTTATPVPKAGTAVDIVRDPADLPAPVGSRGARRVSVDLRTEEVTGTLANGTTFHYWTFSGKVPGPFVRVRVGDIVTVRLTNDASSMMMHNVDFHAVLGPGGGAQATAAGPGETRSFTFKATTPGLYVYHCATMPHAEHIANGMYGMILVEPEGGLPKVDREYYVMQGEIYTDKPFGTKGLLGDSYTKIVNETPEYFVFNGAVGALTEKKPLTSKVGETVRIFFGDAGPNKESSFHAIGQIFDKVYELASLQSPSLRGVQTIIVPPGGAAVVEMRTLVPGRYTLVDHAIARVERGLVGALIVSGPPNDELFKAQEPKMAEM
jgi:nitrite reductase (NO-forming)